MGNFYSHKNGNILSDLFRCSIIRLGIGHIMTSLDMAGANFSIIKLTPKILSLIDAECDFPGWPKLQTPSGKINQHALIESRQTIDDSKV